jgi:hypothetical protein
MPMMIGHERGQTIPSADTEPLSVAVAASGYCDMIYARSFPRGVHMTPILRGTLAALAFTSTVRLAATSATADDFDTCARASGDEAIAACTRAINSGRYNGRQLAALFNNRCAEWNGKQESDKAIADCNQAIRLNPNYANAFNNRGNTYNNKGQYDRAIEDCNQAIRGLIRTRQ